MDYSAVKYSNRNGMQPSFMYKKKRCFWFNSCYNDDFQFCDVNGSYQIDNITFNVPSFELFKCAKMKVISYIKDVSTPTQIIIKLISPYMKFDEITNTDKEAYKMIYINNTGVEGMIGNTFPIILRPQQIDKFVFKLDIVVARYSASVNINYITGTSTFTTLTNAYIQYTGTSNYYRLPLGNQTFTYVDGAITITNRNFSLVIRDYPVLKDSVTGAITSPIASYQFDDANNLGKDSQNNYNLTKSGNPTYSSSVYVKGLGSVQSSSGNNYYESTSFYNFSGKSFTISLWSRRSAISNAYSVLFKVGGTATTAGQYYLLKYNNTNNITFTNGSATVTTASAYSDQDQWTHIVVTYNNTTLIATIYVNSVNSGNANLVTTYSGNTSFRIMNDTTSSYYRGYMDDIRVYDRVLTSTEVTELYYGTISIYTIPSFLLGVEVEDIDLEVDNGVSQYK
jgi:hypothetical protein